MRVLVTGADGFLGWHTRVRLGAVTDHEVVLARRSNWSSLPELVAEADGVIHIAGINRAPEGEVRHGNVALAQDLAAALHRAKKAPAVVFANSTQSATDTPYGQGKREAAILLQDAASRTGATFTDVVLPNLFGEHGRPDYNSFVATFVHKVATNTRPSIVDREVELLHAQQAADILIAALRSPQPMLRARGTTTSVGTVYDLLRSQHSHYRHGEIPILRDDLDIDLFNTLRAAMFPAGFPLPLTRHTDDRGSLVETVRMHGSEGQTFVSTSKPGVVRGQHFHLRKFERFVVLEGEARISLRRLLSKEVYSFDVNGDSPAIVDMPTLWAHNITNIGASTLTTMFWTNALFDPAHPDTYPEEV